MSVTATQKPPLVGSGVLSTATSAASASPTLPPSPSIGTAPSLSKRISNFFRKWATQRAIDSLGKIAKELVKGRTFWESIWDSGMGFFGRCDALVEKAKSILKSLPANVFEGTYQTDVEYMIEVLGTEATAESPSKQEMNTCVKNLCIILERMKARVV